MDILLFFVILLVLILVHEFGHFLTAKYFGILVEEFGIGFPPKLLGIKKGETEYSVNALPFGGFVRIFGENPEEPEEGKDPQRSITHKPRLVQAAVLVAGVFANVVLAWVLLSSAFMIGMPTSLEEGDELPADAHLLILSVVPGTPAEEAGLEPGDSILVLSTDTETLSSPSATDAAALIGRHPGEQVFLTYERGGDERTVSITSLKSDEGKGQLGIALGFVGTKDYSFIEALGQGLSMTWEVLTDVVVSFGMLIRDAFMFEADISQLTGPVGLVGLVGDASSLGLVYVLTFTAFISLNLAVINLLPFPALDGGRLFFLGIEAVRRKPIPPRVANWCNTLGFAFLILLMLVVTYQDILRLLK